jgi:hypothetical protein
LSRFRARACSTSPHGFGGGGEKVGPTVPFERLIADKSQVSLMNERSRLKRVISAFIIHALLRDLTKLVVDEGEQRG